MRVLFWVFVILVGIVLAAFAVANRDTVSLGIWPLPWFLQLPLYLAVLGALLLGLLVGALAAWIGGRGRRREARAQRRRVAALERELADTQARLADAPGSTRLPAPAER
jgi:uncharacterized integral membrane protein